jgi:hypothetical protein
MVLPSEAELFNLLLIFFIETVIKNNFKFKNHTNYAYLYVILSLNIVNFSFIFVYFIM